MDIEEAKKVKMNLENEMADLILRFERETGLSVQGIVLERDVVRGAFNQMDILRVEAEVSL